MDFLNFIIMEYIFIIRHQGSLFQSERHKQLLEINKNRYLGRTDTGRSPNSVPIRRRRQGVFTRRGKWQ